MGACYCPPLHDHPLNPTRARAAPCLQPPLSYAAPELVAGWGGAQSASHPISPAVDGFCLALLVYELLSGSGPLLPVRNSLQRYRDRVLVLQHAQEPLDTMPPPLQGWLGRVGTHEQGERCNTVCVAAPLLRAGLMRAMLSVTPADRPPVSDLLSSPFFQVRASSPSTPCTAAAC